MLHCLFLTLLAAFGSTTSLAAVQAAPGTAEEGFPSKGPDAAEMMQREIDRRKETTFQLNEMLDLADRLYRSGEWDHAEAKYNLVMLQTDPQGQLRGFYERARIGKARCLVAKGLAKEEEGNLAEAAGLLRQATELDPAN